MSQLPPEQWHTFARQAIWPLHINSVWAEDCAAAAVEEYSRLHHDGRLPEEPAKLVVIARHRAIDELRRLEGLAGRSVVDELVRNTLLENGVDESVARGEWQALSLRASQLSERDRVVFSRIVSGWSQASIADELGVTPGRVAQLVARLRITLGDRQL